MKPVILLLAVLTAAFTSCTTAYKTGQTPDDVYYSPARPQEEHTKTEKKETTETAETAYSDEYYDDRYLRMKVRDRYRWSEMDDSYYYNRRYSYSSYNCCCFGNPWTPYSYWNNYYNPYFNNHTVITPSSVATYNKPRTFNLNTYNTNALTNSNYTTPKYNNTSTTSSPANNTYKAPRNSNSNRNNNDAGNTLREVFQGSNSSSSSSSSSSNTRSTTTSSSSSTPSSSSGSSSGSTAPVRKF